MAGTTLNRMQTGKTPGIPQGMTLIELVIVLAVVAILVAIAVPSYSKHMLRVHRSEAIRILLQASMCQERIYAGSGNYDTNQCHPISEYDQYQVSYTPANSQSGIYLAMATPLGAQLADACGQLSIDQNGARNISGVSVSSMKCWAGR